MSMRTALAACAGALLTLSALGTPVQAQLLELDPNQSQWGLTRHEVRVVQFALRDANCYQGRIDGRVGPASRRALDCARQRAGVDQLGDPGFARELALYDASAVGGQALMQREAAGEIDAPIHAQPTQQQRQQQQRQQQQMQPQPTQQQFQQPTTPTTPTTPPTTPADTAQQMTPMTPPPTAPVPAPGTPRTQPTTPTTPPTTPSDTTQQLTPMTPPPTAPVPAPGTPPTTPPTTPPDTARAPQPVPPPTF